MAFACQQNSYLKEVLFYHVSVQHKEIYHYLFESVINIELVLFHSQSLTCFEGRFNTF